MEASSHALALDRTLGCEYDVAVFTNLTQDHLDFHHTMDEYFESKLKLFSGLAGGQKTGKRAIVNLDDPRGAAIRAACSVPVLGLCRSERGRSQGGTSAPLARRTDFYGGDSRWLVHRREPVGGGTQRLQLAGGDRNWRCTTGDDRSNSRKRPPISPMFLAASAGVL